MNSTGIRTACNFSFWAARHYTTCISEHHPTALIVSLSVWIQNYKASQMCRLKYQANWFTFAFNWFSSSFPPSRMLMVITDSYPVYLNVCCVFCAANCHARHKRVCYLKKHQTPNLATKTNRPWHCFPRRKKITS